MVPPAMPPTTPPTRPRTPASTPAGAPVLRIEDATLAYGTRTVWSGLRLDLVPGEFLAVLGANGSGKTSLVRAVLGLAPLSAGRLTVCGRAPGRANDLVGYVQQQRPLDPLTPLRARDVVRQGLDGHRWGLARPGRVPWPAVEAALREVGALEYADRPVGLLSGGEQQRVRVAQAIVSDPALLLCDEPLLSLDVRSQRTITGLVDDRRQRHGTAVVFVTHDINPVLPYVDRVLYLVDGRFRLGPPAEVFTGPALSALYGSPVEVIRRDGLVLVAGVPATSGGRADHDARERLVS